MDANVRSDEVPVLCPVQQRCWKLTFPHARMHGEASSQIAQVELIRLSACVARQRINGLARPSPALVQTLTAHPQ